MCNLTVEHKQKHAAKPTNGKDLPKISKCINQRYGRLKTTHVLHQKNSKWFTVRVQSLVGLCMQDYKSLCAAAMICSILVNIQRHIQTAFDQLMQKAQPAELMKLKPSLEAFY